MTQLEHYIAEYKILVKPQTRLELRPLGYVTHHKTLTDSFGNFLALCTDGVIAWIRLGDDRVITVQLANIVQAHEHKSSCKRSAKPKKPNKTQLRVLKQLKELDIELTAQQQDLLSLYQHLI